MQEQEASYQKHRHRRGPGKGVHGKRFIRLLLSMILAALLVPQVPVSALEGGQPAQDDIAFATLADAVEADAVAPVPSDPQDYAADEIIVVLAGEGSEAAEIEAVEESLDELSGTSDAVETEVFSEGTDGSPLAVVELPTDVSVADALLQLANDESVAFAQPNYLYTIPEGDLPKAGQRVLSGRSGAFGPLAKSNDPYVNDTDQWWLGAVKAYNAWDRQKTNGAVTVAVIDSGVRLTHDDLDDNILQSAAWDAFHNQPLAVSAAQKKIGFGGDVMGHGTHVAGIIAAEANNGLFGAGVSYNANILPINAIDPKRFNLASKDVIAAFDYIIEHHKQYNIRVVNMSFGAYSSGFDADSLMHNKIKDLQDLGILCVAAAGNGGSNANYIDANGDNLFSFPSDFDEVIAVTNVQQAGGGISANSTSDHNRYKDIAAPGTNVLSTYYGNDSSYAALTGTSMASPVVAGIAALLFAKDPSLTPKQVRDILCSTATDLGAAGRDNYYGHGLVNADAALAAIGQQDPPQYYTITFDANGGVVSPSSISRPKDSVLGTLPVPTRDQYTFDGWYTAPSGGTKVTESTKVTANVTYYARWVATSYYYTITFDANGGVVSPSSISRPKDSVLGTLPVPTRDQYTFDGWYTAPSGGTKVTESTKVTANVTYYARWVATSYYYTITFDANGGLVSTPKVSRPKDGVLGALPVPARGQCAFDGWYTAPFGGTKVTESTKVTADVTYYARWVATSFDNTVVTIASALDPSKVLNITGGSTAQGAQLQLWQANTTPAQRFRLEKVSGPSRTAAPAPGYYVIRNINSNKVLDAGHGNPVQQYDRSDASNLGSAQRWRLLLGADGSYTIETPGYPGKALDCTGGSWANGTKLQVYTASGSKAQRFTISPLAPAPGLENGATYTVFTALSANKVLDVSNGSTADGGNIQIYQSNNTGAQKFKLAYDSATGYYTLTNVPANKPLDVALAQAADGTNVQIYQNNGTYAQKWTIVPGSASGTYVLHSACGGLALDVSWGKTDNGTNVQIYTPNGTAAQQWRFKKV